MRQAFDLQRQRLAPKKVLVAARAVHVITTSILLNLSVACRAQAEQIRLFRHQEVKSAVAAILLPLSAHFITNTHCQLPLSAIDIHTEAVILREIAAIQRARLQIARGLHLLQCLVEREIIEFLPRRWIDQFMNLHIINDVEASIMRAFHSHDIENVDYNRVVIVARDLRNTVMQSSVLVDFDGEILSDAARAETVRAIELNNNVVELAEANGALIFVDQRKRNHTSRGL